MLVHRVTVTWLFAARLNIQQAPPNVGDNWLVSALTINLILAPGSIYWVSKHGLPRVTASNLI